jgi:hypothetical protein
VLQAAFPSAELLISDTSPFVRRPSASALGEPRRARRQFTQNASLSSDRRPRPWAKLGKLGGRAARKAALGRAVQLLAESPLLDRQWYCDRYPDVAASGIDPARHYLEFGWQEGRDPGPDFSTRGYLTANQDVAQQGVNPLLHYIEHGRDEGRKAPPSVKAAALS